MVRRRLLAGLCAFSLLVMFGAAAQAQIPKILKPATRPAAVPPDNIVFERDIVYGKGGDREMKLNLAYPKNLSAPAPCVLLIHGGGWTGGNKDQLNEATWPLAARGFVTATVSYRLAPDAIWPAQIEDVKCAVRFLRSSANKYHIDPKRFGAVGFSAGAHLAMLLGTTDEKSGLEGAGGWSDQSSKVQAVVSFFGPTDLTAPEIFPDISPILRKFIGARMSDKPEAYKQASPVTHVRRNSAPMLLLQGTNDQLVNWKQAVKMAEALTNNEVDGRVELLLNQGHGWAGTPLEMKRTAEVTYSFLEEKLNKPAGR